MFTPLVLDTTLHWLAATLYIVATVANTTGIVFEKKILEKKSYLAAWAGLLLHGTALGLRWQASGHGPYFVKYEILSSDAWLALALFLALVRFFPRLRSTSLVVFPAGFLLVGIAVFTNPAAQQLPPTLRSVWLVFHVSFYKLALAALLVALACSFFAMTEQRSAAWLKKLPTTQEADLYAYRFAGIGFLFWGTAMLAGSVWAYQSWGRFWAWDPIETWSLITWGAFGLYLHLRRFFGWQGRRAALLFFACFTLSLISLFFTSLVDTTAHSAYFA